MSEQAPGVGPHTDASAAIRPAALLREVRLGLVCYGGVSLAIYMHGVTKELYKLVRAARAFERAYEANDFDAAKWLTGAPDVQGSANYDSERGYFDALVALKDQGDPLTVVVDIIAGTSAGGINGVCLARGLAEGRSLNGFRNLWLAQADMGELLAGHALFPWGQVKMLSKLAESAARLGWHHDAGLLDGDLMSRLLYQALNDMEPTGDSLVPADESLDLFVTTTNVYGYDTVIPTGAGGISHTDKSYRQLLRFHYDQEPAQEHSSTEFSDIPALAFAARATASFPGAFPPVSIDTFVQALGTQPAKPATRSARSPATSCTEWSTAPARRASGSWTAASWTTGPSITSWTRSRPSARTARPSASSSTSNLIPARRPGRTSRPPTRNPRSPKRSGPRASPSPSTPRWSACSTSWRP